MNPKQLPDTGYVETILSSLDHHPFATLATLLLGVLFVVGLYARKK